MSALYPLKFKANQAMWVSDVAGNNVGQTPQGICPHPSIHSSMYVDGFVYILLKLPFQLI